MIDCIRPDTTSNGIPDNVLQEQIRRHDTNPHLTKSGDDRAMAYPFPNAPNFPGRKESPSCIPQLQTTWSRRLLENEFVNTWDHVDDRY
jgi:hypothetical protein